MSYLFNDTVGFKDNVVDAFNRLKVANPFTIFDSQNRYQPNDKWDSFGVTGGTYSYAITESALNLIVGTTLGSKFSRETKRVFPYQPGKSLLVLSTFAFNQPKEGLRQRIGYFGLTGGATSGVPYNGVYLQQSGLTLSMVMSSASLNTTTTVNQADWNGDPFNGTGASGRNLDISKANILWMDFEWLGVGDVRTGFYVDGKPVIAHTFHNDNTNTTTYMTTACLPIRYELENLTGQTGSSQLKQICSSVISDGGYEGFSKQHNVTHSGYQAHTLITPGVDYPLIALRLNSNRLDSIIIPSNISAALEETGANKPNTVQYRVLLNPTLTGNTWTTHYSGNVDYNITATGVTGGTEIVGGYITSFGAVSISDINNFNFQLGRTQVGVSDVICLVFVPINADSNVFVDFSWYEIV